MKKITKIEVDNFKAYAKKQSINIQGKNLLVYGENGAGKSSLYKSINSFFKNSFADVNFEKNIYNEAQHGNVLIEFGNYINGAIDELSLEEYRFSSYVSNNKIKFIQDASLIKGFLDYTDLLKIYLKSTTDDNLFSLIVENLLKDFIPLVAGSTTSIGKSYNDITNDILNKPRTRRERVHKNGIFRLTLFQTDLKGTLDRIFEKVNELLSQYFGYNDLELSYVLDPITISYGRHGKRSWKLHKNLELVLEKNGVALGTSYKEKLNEARLSSIAICIYLSSLILYPRSSDLKLLYLDDIFVGLDSSNRLPILEIIKDCFGDFQVFISTYDKSFFNIAKLKLSPQNWTTAEFYIGHYKIGSKDIDLPIMTYSKGDYDKARYHLYNSIPDYPASANYFRKSIESLFINNFPTFVLRDGEFINIDSYRLSQIFKLILNFLNNCGELITEIEELREYMYILLHPLSHYQIDATEYKTDLVNIDKLIQKLIVKLPPLNLRNRYRFILERNRKIKLVLYNNPIKKHVYMLKTDEDLIYDNQNKKFLNCKLFAYEMYNVDENDIVTSVPFKPNRNSSQFLYNSIENAYSQISYYLMGEEPNLVSNIKYIKSFKILKGENWKKIF
ncbi:AAA family ATPase [uncultured Chryseobacterium sp.]|uniref:AAA family ATPase n=1 Tax=uncultured Chryseobacterium sp. TaxID=259322 RepID=UPI0025F78ED3|nr:AAA family ATPase [uncultured Chryseobacterium sp.]